MNPKRLPLGLFGLLIATCLLSPRLDALPPPQPAADQFTYAPDRVTVFDVLANDGHSQGRALRVESWDPVSAAGGTVTQLPLGLFRFHPDTGFTGTFEFDYHVIDSRGVRRGPTRVTLDEGTPFYTAASFQSLAVPNLSALFPDSHEIEMHWNFPDPETQYFQILGAVQGSAPAVIATLQPWPTGGPFEFLHQGLAANTTYCYQITAMLPSGPVTSPSGCATTLDDGVPNQAPMAVDDGPFSVLEGELLALDRQALLANDSDPDGDALLFDGVVGGVSSGGTPILEVGQSLLYQAPLGSSTDSFEYRILDDRGAAATATVSLEIEALDRPTACAGWSCNDLSCTFDATCSAFPNASFVGPENLIWRFGSGTSPVTGWTAQHTYPEPGYYWFELEVTEPGTGFTDSVSYLVEAGDPELAAAVQVHCQAGRVCTFDPSGSLLLPVPMSYRWDVWNGDLSYTYTDSQPLAVGASIPPLQLTLPDDGSYGAWLRLIPDDPHIHGAPWQGSFHVADLPPVARLQALCGSGGPPTTCFLDGRSSSDDWGITSVLWDTGSGPVPGDLQEYFDYASAGVFPLTLTVGDAGGQQNQLTSHLLVPARPDLPPTAHFLVACEPWPMNPPIGGGPPTGPFIHLCQLEFSPSHDDGTRAPLSYEWSTRFADGTWIDAPSSTEHSSVRFSTVPGEIDIELRVVDEAGQWSQPVRRTLFREVPGEHVPQAVFSTSCEPSVAQPGDFDCLFDASASSDEEDGSALLFSWDAGGSAFGPSSAATLSHTLPAGVHSVSVTAADSSGRNDTYGRILRLGLAESPPPSAVLSFAACESGLCTLEAGLSASLQGVAAVRWQITDTTSGEVFEASGARVRDLELPSGSYLVELSVTGEEGQSATDAVALTVSRRPQAEDDVVTAIAGADTPIFVLDNDSDPDGDALGLALLTPPEHGTVTLVGGGNADQPRFVYTSQARYSGPDRFAYLAFDGVHWAPAQVLITVER